MTISYSKSNDHAARILESMTPAQRRQMAQMVPEARELLYPPLRAVEDTDLGMVDETIR
jgi:hypothetical protein